MKKVESVPPSTTLPYNENAAVLYFYIHGF